MEVEGTNYIFTTVIIGVLIGASVLILFYILNLLKSNNNKNEKHQTDKKKESLASGKSSTGAKKKAPESRWTGRSEKQGFTHPWLLTSLKGHSAQVLDMDFASNGKYLASSAEEDPDPGGNTSSSSTSSDFLPDNSSPSSASSSPPLKGLSRRQRKNRRRDDHSPSENKKKPKAKRPENVLNHKSIVNVSLKQYLKLKLAENVFASFFRSYLLSPDQMLAMGYPVELPNSPGRPIIFKSPMNLSSYTQSSYYRCTKINVNESRFDVNAQEFIPAMAGMDYSEIKAEWSAGHDSGQGSGSSSDSGDNVDDSDGSDISDKLDEDNCESANVIVPPQPSDAHKCVRCGQIFLVTSDGEYLTQESCHYHPSKLVTKQIFESDKHIFVKKFECCSSEPYSTGCSVGKYHVWSGLKDGVNGPFDNYVRTKPRRTPPSDGNFGVYALDCEMCYTTAGLEVTKITVIALDGRLVYDTFVKPEREVIDYNTTYSGITAKDLCKKGATKTLREVQNDLMGFINADTVLVGHGLENDLRALKIIHGKVVDTALTFPHYKGLPYRRSLKSIAFSILRREIQARAGGHSSFEDAHACMELMLWRIHNDFGSIIHYQ